MSALDDLVSLLDLEQLEVNLFRGYSRDRDRVRLYGGEVLAQALMAAGRTVDDEPETIDREGGPHVIDALDFRHVGDPWEPGVNRGTPVRDPDQDTWFRT